MTNITRIIAIAVLCAGTALAADPFDSKMEFEFAPTIHALQEALELTDAQAERIKGQHEAFKAEVDTLAEAMSAKSAQLDEEMQRETPNETIIGSLLMELTDLYNQVETIAQRHRALARGVLTPAQAQRLAPIEAAVAVMEAAYEAIDWNLVAPPEYKTDPVGDGGPATVTMN